MWRWKLQILMSTSGFNMCNKAWIAIPKLLLENQRIPFRIFPIIISTLKDSRLKDPLEIPLSLIERPLEILLSLIDRPLEILLTPGFAIWQTLGNSAASSRLTPRKSSVDNLQIPQKFHILNSPVWIITGIAHSRKYSNRGSWGHTFLKNPLELWNF